MTGLVLRKRVLIYGGGADIEVWLCGGLADWDLHVLGQGQNDLLCQLHRRFGVLPVDEVGILGRSEPLGLASISWA
jgi:hypothetical protein